ncbi:uncharacterized protein LOC143291051 [Babylonia areolata]|uniref:uncharacterized protein LOC143291051 n=1 Tax=Babylonia areolata TaxID=304850 RepID=UPI003FD67FDC
MDCVHMYKLVVNFKDKLSKLFSEMGLVVESMRLDELETVSIETEGDGRPPVKQLSSNVLLVLQLVVELVHAIAVSKCQEAEGLQTAEKGMQTEDSLSDAKPALVPQLTVVTCGSTATAAGQERGEEEGKEKDGDGEQNLIVAMTPAGAGLATTTPIPCQPLRKSLRTSVLNRKPFAMPRPSRRRRNAPTPPTRLPANSAGRATAAAKHAAKPPAKPPPRTSPPKPSGARKRKLGAVKKKGVVPPAKKGVRETMEVEVKEEEEGVESKPRRCRQRSGLATSMYERTAEGKFRCLECGKVAKLQTNIRKHLRKHTGEKPYQCSVCPAVFAYPRSLKRHQLVHEGRRPYRCPQCDKCFFDPTSLRTHSRVHTDDRPFVCQICGNRFRQKEGLKGHMRRHTGDRPYVCERCGMAFAAKRSLTRHIRVHTGERPYSCDQCVAAFADWTTLHNHKLVHRSPPGGEGEGGSQEGEGGSGQDGQDKDGIGGVRSEHRPYQCQFCGIRYRQPLSLKRHIRLHSSSSDDPPKRAAPKRCPRRRVGVVEDGGREGGEGEPTALHLQYRPYACEVCGERFKHLRGYHTHKNKHQSGAVTERKGASRRPKQETSVLQETSLTPTSHLQQVAASLLASVAVQDVSQCSAAPDRALAAHSITVGQEDVPVSPHHHLPAPHITGTIPQPGASMQPPDSISMAPTSHPHPHPPHTHGTSLPLSLLPHPAQPPPPQQANAGTVTIIDAAAFGNMAGDPPNMHLPVSSAPLSLTETGEVIQYTSGNVTQVIQYPDGTLSEVTTLLPHPPPPSILPSSDLLDSVVTVVFETRDGSVVLENQ